MEKRQPVSFLVPGRIGGKGRPRFTATRGHARAYTPKKTASMEAVVRQFGALAMRGKPLLSGPLVLEVVVGMSQPDSWSQKKRAENQIPTGKPDLDNVVKLIGDSLNGIVWQDDSQISSLSVHRHFVPRGDQESTLITVREMVPT